MSSKLVWAAPLAMLWLGSGCGNLSSQSGEGTTGGEAGSAADAPQPQPEGGSGCAGECSADADCNPGQSCIECVCFGEPSGCDQWGPGEFADCVTEDGSVDVSVCGLDGAQCLADSSTSPTAGVCFTSCQTACDCPAPPQGFEAQVVCDDVIGDGQGDCIISCSGNAPCPDGAYCVFGACLYGEAPVGQVPPYGDCINDGLCEESATCIANGDGSLGACAETCEATTDCSDAPMGSTAQPECVALSSGSAFCFLTGCDGEEDCPQGMSCGAVGETPTCLWEMAEPEPDDYDDCANNPAAVCGDDAACVAGLVDGEDETAFCANAGCEAGSDCPSAGGSGDAAPTCGDLGDGDVCYLDCSGGQTCPDGMVCSDAGACSWQATGLLLDERFESGTFRPGWLRTDVDGQVPAPAVGFVDEAWVVQQDLGEPDFYAVSTSWYSPGGQADDWLITPALELGESSVLSWEARAQDPEFPDGYEVRISATGTEPEDFLAEEPLFSAADGEMTTWQMREVDLSAYANETVYIGIRNNSTDQFLLLVDSIAVAQ